MHIDKIDKKFTAVAQSHFIFTIVTQCARLITITFVYEKRSAKFQDMPTFAISRGIMASGAVSHFFPDLGVLSFSLS